MVFEMDYLWAACAAKGDLGLVASWTRLAESRPAFSPTLREAGMGKLMRLLLGGSNDDLPRTMQFREAGGGPIEIIGVSDHWNREKCRG